MNAGVGEHVNLPVEEVFEVLAEAHKIEKRASGLHVYEQIHVAVGTILAASDRPEQTDVVSAVARRDSENVVPLVLKVHRVLWL